MNSQRVPEVRPPVEPQQPEAPTGLEMAEVPRAQGEEKNEDVVQTPEIVVEEPKVEEKSVEQNAIITEEEIAPQDSIIVLSDVNAPASDIKYAADLEERVTGNKK